MDRVPRDKRIVIDCDGNYNDAMNVRGRLQPRGCGRQPAVDRCCDSLADRVSPTDVASAKRPNVRPFFFHGYDPAWEQPLDFDRKEFGMVYVGHSKFRWGPMGRCSSGRAQSERGGAIGSGRPRLGCDAAVGGIDGDRRLLLHGSKLPASDSAWSSCRRCPTKK